jgi:hypothetical protein
LISSFPLKDMELSFIALVICETRAFFLTLFHPMFSCAPFQKERQALAWLRNSSGLASQYS